MNPRRYKETAVRGAESGVVLTQELIDEFIASIQTKGYVQGTVDRYQTSLEQLYDSLSGEKRIGRGTLAACRKQMLEDGYAVRTANLRISAANSLLGYLGLREYQLTDHKKQLEEIIAFLKEQGKTVIMISHEIPLVFKVADSAVILSGGKKIYEGGKEALARRDDIFDSINISLPPVVRLSRRYGFGKVCYNVEEFAEQAAAMLKREDA